MTGVPVSFLIKNISTAATHSKALASWLGLGARAELSYAKGRFLACYAKNRVIIDRTRPARHGHRRLSKRRIYAGTTRANESTGRRFDVCL